MRVLRTAFIGLLIAAAVLAGAEFGRRVLDGYLLGQLRLAKDPRSLDLTWSTGTARESRALVASIPADKDARLRWFDDRPAEQAPPQEAWVIDRRTRGHDAGANYVWNAASFDLATELSYFRSIRSGLDEIFAFRPLDGNRRPRYRFYPGIQTGFGLTNHFGWKSREITLQKPPRVIRIATLGDSTTNNYPKLVEHWLNLWAAESLGDIRFEMLDASRPASDAEDAAAIFERELPPADPDYVLVYGFGNAIADARALIPVATAVRSAGRQEPRLQRLRKRGAAMLDPLTRWSAAAIFLQHRISGDRGDNLMPEPAKPETAVSFPVDIDEHSPSAEAVARHHTGHIMGLDGYIQSLDRMEKIARRHDIGIFVGTFRVFAKPGEMLPRNEPLYQTLNEGYWWPYTYAEVARIVSFYNRTLRAWAEQEGAHVIPIDERMPWEHELYLDGIHELPAGEALHAWIVLQQLMPAVRADISAGRLPRQSPASAALYSEQYWRIERMKTADAIAAGEAMNMAAASPPADEIADAFPLSAITTAGPGASVVRGLVPQIITSDAASSYAAAIPLSSNDNTNGPGWVDVDLHVTSGRLSAGLLDRSGRRFLIAGGASESAAVQSIRLRVDDLAEIGSLIISNDRADRARSSGELRSVVLKRIR